MRPRSNKVFATVLSSHARVLKKTLLANRPLSSSAPVAPKKQVPNVPQIQAALPVVEAPVIAAVPALPLIPQVNKDLIASFEDLQDLVSDPISMELLLNDPVITPAGHTYNRATLNNGRDPMANVGLNQNELLPNHLAGELAAYFDKEEDDVDLSQVPPALICKETGELFQFPVVAANGKTYEEDWIIRFHRDNGNTLPTGEKQESLQLYPNRVVQNLTDEFKKGMEVENRPAAKL